MTWLPPLDRLTQAQSASVTAETNRPLILRGGPGSGKTVVLLHRAKRLGLASGHPSKVALLVYTNVLRDFIRSATHELGLSEETVLTFDHWCRLRYVELVGPPPVDKQGHPDFSQIRKGLLARLSDGKSTPLLDVALVDEGQDLDDECYSLLRLSARHVTVAFDLKQSLYRESGESSIRHALGAPARELDLQATYRACPYVVDLACEFIADEAEKEAFRAQPPRLRPNVRPPCSIWPQTKPTSVTASWKSSVNACSATNGLPSSSRLSLRWACSPTSFAPKASWPTDNHRRTYKVVAHLSTSLPGDLPS